MKKQFKQLKIVRDATNQCWKAYDGDIAVASKGHGQEWVCFPGYELILPGDRFLP